MRTSIDVLGRAHPGTGSATKRGNRAPGAPERAAHRGQPARCKTGEIVQLRDMFGFERIKEGTYTPGQIDQRWSDPMEKDFSKWLNDHIDKLPVPREQIQELLKERTW